MGHTRQHDTVYEHINKLT